MDERAELERRTLYLAKKARAAGRKMVVLFNDADLDAIDEWWREDLLKTLDDISMRVELARAMVSGGVDPHTWNRSGH